MARSRRVYAAPLVVAVALMPGCSGKIEGTPGGDGDGDADVGGNPPYFGNTGGGPTVEATGGYSFSTGGSPPVVGTGGLPPIGGNPPFFMHPCDPPFEDCEQLPACPVVDQLDGGLRGG